MKSGKGRDQAVAIALKHAGKSKQVDRSKKKVTSKPKTNIRGK